ncbi:MAG TPA: MFS transporter [Candidatus Saccharimonadales bacterium]|nr:MFS transporter [Candidatus Saccharimonadales bacterium]
MTDKHRGHWIILILLALAQFMVVLDSSIVNVALPALERSLHFSTTNLQWVITAYTLAFGGFLLLGGRAADLFGRRKTFLAGVAFFVLASLADGLATNSGMLIGLRAVQGLAAAFMSPAALSIVLITYREGHERNIALSVWGAVASGGAAAGVLLGGVITEYLGWRWNFFINVPVGLAVLVGTYRMVPKHESEETHNSLDLPGAVSVTAGLMLLVYGLVKAPMYGWTNHSTLLLLGSSAALLVFFVLNELRAKHPLVPFSIFKIRNVSGANLTMLPLIAALFSTFFFSSLYVQMVLHYSPVRTGLSFLVMPVVLGIAATNAPRLIKKFGYKKVVTVAPFFVAIGLFMLGHVPVHGNYFTDIMPALIIMAGGMGFNFVGITIAATSGVPGRQSGLASGLLNTSQQIGGALGLAILSGAAAAASSHYFMHHPVATQLGVTTAQVHGFHVAYYIASGFALGASAMAALIIRQQKSPAAEDGAVVTAG